MDNYESALDVLVGGWARAELDAGAVPEIWYSARARVMRAIVEYGAKAPDEDEDEALARLAAAWDAVMAPAMTAHYVRRFDAESTHGDDVSWVDEENLAMVLGSIPEAHRQGLPADEAGVRALYRAEVKPLRESLWDSPEGVDVGEMAHIETLANHYAWNVVVRKVQAALRAWEATL